MKTSAWYCQICGRVEAPKNEAHCPDCDTKMQRCSRYEWFLIDELEILLELSDRDFNIIPQYPIKDHRGFNWYWDIYIWLAGASLYGGYSELIDINGPDHNRQKKYSGPGGGYTRDKDKHWEAFSNLKLHKQGFGVTYIQNDDCKKKNIKLTALEIMGDLLTLADTFC